MTFGVHTRQGHKQQINATQTSLRSLHLLRKRFEVHKSEKKKTKEKTADLAAQDGVPGRASLGHTKPEPGQAAPSSSFA